MIVALAIVCSCGLSSRTRAWLRCVISLLRLMASVESFVIASSDHQDALFRLVQYAARLVGAMHVGPKREALFALSNSMDGSRIMARTFGLVYALRAVFTPHVRVDDLISDLALCGYFPCEAGYWCLLATASPKLELRRNMGRLTSLFGLVYAIFAGRALYAKLREFRAQTGIPVSGATKVSAIDDSRKACVPAEAILQIQRQLWKNALDGLLCCHWALDHSRIKLSHWQVGLVGTISAYLGLRLKWSAHAQVMALKDQEHATALSEEQEEEQRNMEVEPKFNREPRDHMSTNSEAATEVIGLRRRSAT
jgi:hypothetical protein